MLHRSRPLARAAASLMSGVSASCLLSWVAVTCWLSRISAICLMSWASATCVLGASEGSPEDSSAGEEELKTYFYGDTLEIRGRIDRLNGIAATSSEGRIGHVDFALRPLLREAELIETVPGLIATQHSGDGKSNQMFLRGFNLDHGTDFRTTLDGMPVNLPTHGHGQGYTDLNFIVPELVHHIEYRKGVFHPELGDFGSAGGAELNLFRSLPRPFFKFDIGEHRYRRAVGAGSQVIGPGAALIGVEVKGYDGPWELEQSLKKVSGMARYSWETGAGSWSLLGMGYSNDWNASDQIPRRAVMDGRISRFGQIDSTLGGSSSRYSLSLDFQRDRSGASWSAQVYFIDYSLDLFSNFTYRLADPEQGDQLEQVDERTVLGGGARLQKPVLWGGRDHLIELGVETRNDFIDEVALYHSRGRQRLETVRRNEVVESTVGGYANASSRWHPRFRSELGFRGDLFYFDVTDENIVENSGTETAGVLSPKGSVIFRPGEWGELYLSGGLGFHSNDARGTVIAIDPATGEPAEPVDPVVTSRGAEVGIRTDFVKELRSTVSVWWLELDSELVFVGDGGGTEPSDESGRYGVEWANFYRPNDRLALDLDFSLSEARLRGVDGGADRVPGALENVFAAGVSWMDPEGFVGALRLRHLGSYPLLEDDSIRAEATTLVNASAGHHFGNTRITLALLNMFDEEASDIQYYYESRLPGEPAGGIADLHFHPAEPRQLRVSIDVGL